MQASSEIFRVAARARERKPALMSATPEAYQETIHFIGRVQGVGFRYATLQTAREFEVAGYVQNLPDGRVVLEIEGEPGEMDDFVAEIEKRMEGYIRKVERSRRRGARQLSGFTIR